MKRNKAEKQVAKFLKYLRKLEPIEGVGVARLLGVNVTTREDGTDPNAYPCATIQEQDMDILLSEILDAFIAQPEEKRDFILDIMKQAGG